MLLMPKSQLKLIAVLCMFSALVSTPARTQENSVVEEFQSIGVIISTIDTVYFYECAAVVISSKHVITTDCPSYRSPKGSGSPELGQHREKLYFRPFPIAGAVPPVEIEIEPEPVEIGKGYAIFVLKQPYHLPSRPYGARFREPEPAEEVFVLAMNRVQTRLSEGCQVLGSFETSPKVFSYECSQNPINWDEPHVVLAKSDSTILGIDQDGFASRQVVLEGTNPSSTAVLLESIQSQSPVLNSSRPPVKGYPQPFRPLSLKSIDEALYDSTCFNMKTGGNFLSKTLREMVASEEAQAIGAAICTYYSGAPAACVKTAQEGANLVNSLTKHSGSDSWGIIRARPNYEICRAFFVENDWSVTSATTFNTTITRSGADNGLSFYVSMPTGKNRRDWIDVKLIVEQVPVGKVSEAGCWPTGSNPWICKGSGCSALMEGAKVALPETIGSPPVQIPKCIEHGK